MLLAMTGMYAVLKQKINKNAWWRNTYSINLIQSFPLFIGYTQSLCCLYCPLHLACPHFEIMDILLVNVFSQAFGKLRKKIKQLTIVQQNRLLDNYKITDVPTIY